MDRTVLNEALLEEISSLPNIRTFFDHKVQSVDFRARTITARDSKRGKDARIDFDFCIGADGSYSVVRRQLMRVIRSVPSCVFGRSYVLIFFFFLNIMNR